MASRDGLLHVLSGAQRTAWPAILVGSACVLTACGGGGEDSGSGSAAGVATHLSITTASSAASGTPFNVTVSALDGAGSLVSAYSGTVHLTSTDSQAVLAANSMLTNGSGTFSVTLTTPGSQTVTATDTASPSISGISGAINVAAAEVVITSGAPPDGKVGDLYSPGTTTYCQPIGGRCIPCIRGGNRACRTGYRTIVSGRFEFSATGGQQPYSWSWAAKPNSRLPPGLTLDPAGTISGRPTYPGFYDVTVSVTDSESPAAAASADYIIVVANPPAPVINTAASSSGTLNVPYSFIFSAAFGLAPFTWSETGALPSGLSLSSGGVLSGTPTKAGSFPITVRVHDSIGQDAVSQNFTIDVYAHGFRATGNMTSARASVTATVLESGQVLVLGGDTASAEVFDPASGAFTTAGSMTTPRVYHTATLLANGKVLVAGGQDPGGVVLATAEIFDPTTGTFILVGSMGTPRSTHTAALLDSGRVLVTGGRDAGGAPLAAAEIFDPATGVFVRTGDMGTPRFEHTTTPLSDGRALVTGGVSTDGHATATAEVFDPAAGVFTPTGSVRSAVYSHVATLLKDGRVLVAGGLRYDANRNGDFGIASADVFDPASGAFTTAGNMATPRANHTATLLADGTVLITGGVDSQNRTTASAELFDPIPATFSKTGEMATPRYWHAASLLNDGRVLVTGGGDGDNRPLSTAELYD